MGAGGSKSSENSSGNEGCDESLENAGGQFYVSLKMEFSKLSGYLPHVYGSAPLVGSWDPSKANRALVVSCDCYCTKGMVFSSGRLPAENRSSIELIKNTNQGGVRGNGSNARTILME